MHRRAVSAAAGDGVDAVLFVLLEVLVSVFPLVVVVVVVVALGKKKDVEKERDDEDDDVATTCNPERK